VRTPEGRKIRVSELVKDGKIVLLHFFATFCHNSNYDVVTVNDLYRTYREAGLTVVGISEYSTRRRAGEVRWRRHKPLYPLVTEEETGTEEDPALPLPQPGR
jgi:peroxiredoxin